MDNGHQVLKTLIILIKEAQIKTFITKEVDLITSNLQGMLEKSHKA